MQAPLLPPGRSPAMAASTSTGARIAFAAVALAALAAAGWFSMRSEPQGPLGLFTSLPIYWREAGDISAALDPDGKPHWARSLIEEDRELRPLDVLTPEALKPFHDLLVAQPRALAPAENVALDAWVRGGGHLLLFADPMLTEESAFAIGDRRRPMDVALLSPILAHWGLELQFDQAQRPGEALRDLMGVAVPTNLAGHFATRGQANCMLWGDGLSVSCAIGKGRVIAVADAAVLEDKDPRGTRRKALEMLLDSAFAAR